MWINEEKIVENTVNCDQKLYLQEGKSSSSLFIKFVSKLSGTSTENEEGFKRRLFDNFERTGICGVMRHGKVVSSDAMVAEFKKLMISEYCSTSKPQSEINVYRYDKQSK